MGCIDFAIVHHANQYIITNGYRNREGLDDVLGIRGGHTGYLKILELHQEYKIPFNLHLSGTLFETILWHCPDFLDHLRALREQGLVDFICSSYGQNIMRFFDYRHNFRQLNECIRLYREQLGAEPRELKVFWPPERIWDTKRLAPVLTDGDLLNQGHQYVLIDDRLFYPARHGMPSRRVFDEGLERSCADFYPCRIVQGNGLTALPISSFLRQNIPPRDNGSLERLDELFRWLAEKNSQVECSLIAIYGDDLEKSSGCCGWDEGGPAQYEAFLQWLVRNPWVRPVKLNQWVSTTCVACQKPIEVGSYFEMSRQFGAGEGYEKWYFDPNWKLYRGYYAWTEEKVAEISAKGGDPDLLEMAGKHLLASSWETAWHTPPYGVHGNAASAIEPSPWIKAVTSHSRHAAVIAEAAYWMKHKDGSACACLEDIDNDGQEELILKNERLFAVFSPACGGRLVYLFNVSGAGGKMVIGNPSDDWNWLEELNKYMRVPPNHPGALAEAGYEDDRYEAAVTEHHGDEARAILVNKQENSQAEGLEKSLRLVRGSDEIEVTYQLPGNLADLAIDCGLSPDYAHLLRAGRGLLKEHAAPDSRGFSNNGVSVWVRLEDPARTVFDSEAMPREFGHGCTIRLRPVTAPFTIWIGTEQTGGP